MAAGMPDEDGLTVGMVVDDDELVRESVAAMLEDLCDHVYQASDGQEGMEVLGGPPRHFAGRDRHRHAAP